MVNKKAHQLVRRWEMRRHSSHSDCRISCLLSLVPKTFVHQPAWANWPRQQFDTSHLCNAEKYIMRKLQSANHVPRKRRQVHLSPHFGGQGAKMSKRLHKKKRSPWITVSKTANVFRIGWNIIEKSRSELDPKWTRLRDLVPTRSSWWRHFRWKCKYYWELCWVKFWNC